jgi:hypothetical protein
MLDPARLGKVLRELALIGASNRTRMIEDDRSRTGRPLIQREDEGHADGSCARIGLPSF